MDPVELDWYNDIMLLRAPDLRELADALDSIGRGESGTLTLSSGAEINVYVDHTVAVVRPYCRPSSQ